MQPLVELRRRASTLLVPPPRLALSDWIEANIRLPDGVTALPGAVRLWPWQRGIADAIGDPEIERVTLVKSVRVGFTTLLTGCIAAHVVNDPAPVLCVQPTESDCRDFVVSDLEPTFAASPTLRNTLDADTEDGGRNTLLSRRFTGGSLKVVAARAPRNLRRHTARVLLIDEADAMETGAEGSPITLAERRTLSFANRKIVIGSTPLLADTSNVLRSYAASDKRIYECPCPACGAFTELLWSHIEWQPDAPDTAAFRCPHCNALVEERHKRQMVEGGRWRATDPTAGNHAGFRLNALVSMLANASWGKLAAEFLRAKDDPAELQVFINTVLAQGWNEAADEVDESELQARAEAFDLNNVPAEVLAITAGVDVQEDRLEVTFCGWTRANECLVLAHVVLWGSPDDDSSWAELDELLKTRPTHPYGARLRIDCAVVDSGDRTDTVYNFCFPRAGRRILAGKGVAGSRPAIQVSVGKIKGGRLWIIGVDGLKGQILSRLARGRTIRFSNALEAAYYEQLASEKRVVRYTRGQPVRRFVRRPGGRAEALDCMVYAFAARAGLPLVYDQREAELKAATAPPPVPSVIRSKWLDGG